MGQGITEAEAARRIADITLNWLTERHVLESDTRMTWDDFEAARAQLDWELQENLAASGCYRLNPETKRYEIFSTN
jgi:hypothetical protein